jgi:hypothetical protein
MRLRVLDCVFEANGYAKPRGNWKGSLTEIAEKDGLKEAAERLCGIGKYLKRQDETILYIYNNSTDDGMKKEMRRLAGQRNLNLPPGAEQWAKRQAAPQRPQGNMMDVSSSIDRSNFLPQYQEKKTVVQKPATKTAVQRSAEVWEGKVEVAAAPPQQQAAEKARPDLYPQHNALVKSSREKVGITSDWLVSYLDKHCNGLRPAQMTIDEINQILKVMAIAVYQGRYQNQSTAESSYEANLQVLVGDRQSVSHFPAFCRWCDQSATLAELVTNKAQQQPQK